MAKKSLIFYQTNTHNTEKVALRFKSTFEKNGWVCDAVRLKRDTDLGALPQVKDYDFLCLGAPVHGELPPEEMRCFGDIIRSPGKMEHITLATFMEIKRRPPSKTNMGGCKPTPHKRIALGSKKGVVFATYGGVHLGPKEADAALKWLELMMEHARFRCVGSFACPGRFGLLKGASPGAYFGDMRGRPNERDLTKAEIFLEEILETFRWD
jgi:flavodoxin